MTLTSYLLITIHSDSFQLSLTPPGSHVDKMTVASVELWQLALAR